MGQPSGGVSGIAIAGRHIFRVQGDGVAAYDVDAGTMRAFPVTRPDGIVGIGDAAWIASEGGTRLAWHDTTGRTRAVCELPRTGGAVAAFTADRALGVSAVVQGIGDAAWVRAPGAGRIATSGEVIVPAGEALIVRSGRRLVVRRDGREAPLQLPAGLDAAACVGGAILARGGRVGLALNDRAGRHVIVVDMERRTTLVHMRLTGALAISWVEERAHAVVLRAREVIAIDLERGRVLSTRELSAPATELATDERGELLALADRDELPLAIEYPAFAGSARSRPPRGTPTDVPPVMTERETPEPEVLEAAPDVAEVEAPCAREPTANTTPPVDEPPLPTAPLQGLGLARPAAPLEPGDLRAFLDDAYGLVAALCRRAIAAAWDRGLASAEGPVSAASEITALCDHVEGRAPEALAIARAREADAWSRFARWQHPGSPLAELARELALSPAAAVLLLLVAAPYLWGDLARAYELARFGRPRPIVDELFLAQLLGAARGEHGALGRELDDRAPLLRGGAVERSAGPRLLAALTVPQIILDRLAGLTEAPEPPVLPLAHVVVPRPALSALLAALAVRSPTPARVVLRGRAGAGRRTLAAALAALADRRLAPIELAVRSDAGGDEAPEIRLRRSLREAAIRGALPCVSGVDRLGDDPTVRDRVQAVLDDHPGPLALRIAPDARPPLAAGWHVLDFETLEPPVRRRVWTDALARQAPGVPTAIAEALAERFLVGPGVVEQVAAAASAQADPERALVGALRQHRLDRIAGVADRVEWLAGWSDLVLPDDMIDSLRELVARLRHRELVLGAWGMSRVTSAARGVTALFQGSPGTGKTLAAGVLARELGYDLYRIDLSRTFSKWLGETEKNLATVFDAAEDGEVILLFDEADSLFGKRTEVRSSNDRYANVEVNYLLQRLDRFNGIALLTTNFGTAVDPAFRRRLALQLQFPFPDEEERERLWRAQLPATVPVRGDLALPALARRFKLSGGYIRNAALRACYLAAAEGSPLTADHLTRAVRLEFRDLAKVSEDSRLE